MAAPEIGWLKEFATRYAAAWSSHDALRVASFFAEQGTLTINGAAPSAGRSAIAAAAQDFMTTFPDMVVSCDAVDVDGDRAIFRWTLTGTNTGPGGTGNAVRVSGHERWAFGADGLIASSLGCFDEAEYRRQIAVGVGPT
jgi:uncharacterized protein (TIGR02246 family)